MRFRIDLKCAKILLFIIIWYIYLEEYFYHIKMTLFFAQIIYYYIEYINYVEDTDTVFTWNINLMNNNNYILLLFFFICRQGTSEIKKTKIQFSYVNHPSGDKFPNKN